MALVLLPPFIPEEPHLGLAYLASYLKAQGLTVAVHDISIRLFHAAPEEHRHHWDRSGATAERWQKRETLERFLELFGDELQRGLEQVLERGPRVVGVSCHMTNSVITMEAVRRLRELPGGDAPVVVAGGPAFFVNAARGGAKLCMYGYPTMGRPELREQLERWFSAIDAVVLDEGELPLAEICRRALAGESLEGVPNTARPGHDEALVREPPIRDVSAIPFPTFEEFDLSLYTHPQLPVLFNRGCIKKCTCCTERHRWGKFRARKAEQILEELRHHVEVLGIRRFDACDMLLNAHVPELSRLCEMIIEEGLGVV